MMCSFFLFQSSTVIDCMTVMFRTCMRPLSAHVPWMQCFIFQSPTHHCLSYILENEIWNLSEFRSLVK